MLVLPEIVLAEIWGQDHEKFRFKLSGNLQVIHTNFQAIWAFEADFGMSLHTPGLSLHTPMRWSPPTEVTDLALWRA